MKNILIAIIATFLLAPVAMAQDLATYSISTAVEGMTVPGQKPGVGDRSLSFILNIDPEDPDAANELYYSHLEILLGPDDLQALRAEARRMTRGGRGLQQ